MIKLHGDVRSDELLVFSASDYMKRWQAPTQIDGFVSLLFSTHTILFIGYSLNDEHIVSILEREALIAPPERRRKYMLVYELDDHRRQYLRAVNVVPIEIASLSTSHEEAVCQFLYRLREQHDYFEIRTKILEDKPKTQPERLLRAMLYHQDARFERAKLYLEEIYTHGVEPIQDMEFLPVFLWLNVSIHDKLDDWSGLLVTEREIRSMFRKLDRIAPPEAVQMMKMSYFATLALAYVRHGDSQALRSALPSLSPPIARTLHTPAYKL